MSFLLDSNVCIGLLRTGKAAQTAQQTIRRHLDAAEALNKEVIVCSVVRMELLIGALMSANPEPNLARVAAFLAAFPTLPFDDAAAEHAARIQAHLQRKGMLITPPDILISAIALSRRLTVVTHNTADFIRIPDLHVEDWETQA